MRQFRPIVLWGLAILVGLSLVRLLALWLYSPPGELQFADLAPAFWLGLRFDLSTVCYVSALPVLLLSFGVSSGLNKSAWMLQRFLHVYLTLFTTLIVFLSIINLIYYTYFQDHLNIMVFGFFEDDTAALVSTMWKNYPVIWIVLGLLSTTIGSWILLGKLLKYDLHPAEFPRQFSWNKTGLCFVLILSLSLGARGSFGLFPLGVADATISNKPFVNYLAFSGIHSLHRAVKLRLRERAAWNINAKTYGYHDARTAAQDFLGTGELPPSEDPLSWFQRDLPVSPVIEKMKPHVVVLMIESFGSSWLRYQTQNFNVMGELQKHFDEDPVFLNFVPSMTATIGSLSSIMINTPHRPEGGFLTESRYLQVPFRTAPARVYKEAGYKTRFIYGGAIGWRDIDKFARTQGFESVEGDFEIEKRLGRKLETHDWGFFDEDVWEYLSHTLQEATQPQLIVVMSTTNHPPYQLPSSYQQLPLEIPAEIRGRLNVDEDLARKRFAAFQYSNQKLGEFLTEFKSSKLAQNTIIAATGDHGFLIINFDETELLQKWQVPLYLYLPPALRPARINTKVFGSHADIFPTLMPLSLSGKRVPMIGRNLLDPEIETEAYHYSRLALSPAGAVVVENAKTTRFFTWEKEHERLVAAGPDEKLEKMARRYKALMSFLDEYYEHERKHARKGP